MRRNIEAKFREVDLAELKRRALAMLAVDHGELRQADTFFRCANGRLKLREFGDGTGELISYSRADETASRASDYQISRSGEPDTLLEVLEISCGITGRVRKTRNLLLWKNVRIHLDRVEGLGEFAELESVVSSDVDESTARENLDTVIDGLGLRDATRMAGAYVDLIARQV